MGNATPTQDACQQTASFSLPRHPGQWTTTGTARGPLATVNHEAAGPAPLLLPVEATVPSKPPATPEELAKWAAAVNLAVSAAYRGPAAPRRSAFRESGRAFIHRREVPDFAVYAAGRLLAGRPLAVAPAKPAAPGPLARWAAATTNKTAKGLSIAATWKGKAAPVTGKLRTGAAPEGLAGRHRANAAALEQAARALADLKAPGATGPARATAMKWAKHAMAGEVVRARLSAVAPGEEGPAADLRQAADLGAAMAEAGHLKAPGVVRAAAEGRRHAFRTPAPTSGPVAAPGRR